MFLYFSRLQRPRVNPNLLLIVVTTLLLKIQLGSIFLFHSIEKSKSFSVHDKSVNRMWAQFMQKNLRKLCRRDALCRGCCEVLYAWVTCTHARESAFCLESLFQSLLLELTELSGARRPHVSGALKEIGIFFNPLHPNISAHILHTALYSFPKGLTRRIGLTIKRFFSQ